MQVDQNKLVSMVIDKTTLKLNSLQSQTIILESQLQLALEEIENLQKELDKVKKSNGKSSDKTGTY